MGFYGLLTAFQTKIIKYACSCAVRATMSLVALQRALSDDEQQLTAVQRAKILNLIRNSAHKVPWMQRRLRLFGTLVYSVYI